VKKLDWFVLKSFFWPLIMTFFIVLFIQIMQFLWMYVDDMAGKGLELNVLMELLLQFSLVFVPTALPLGILLASLMTFGNMGENFELSAIKSSGISLQRIMRPLIILIILVSIGSFFFANKVVPYSNRKARTLMYDIQRKRPELNLQAATFYNGIDGISIKIGKKDPETNKLEDILIYDHRDQAGNNSVILADSGYMKMTPDESGLIFTLYDGYSYNDIVEKNVAVNEKKYPFRSDKFSSYSFLIELSGFDLDRSDLNLFNQHQAMKDLGQLNYHIDSLEQRKNNKNVSYVRDYTKTKLYTRSNFKTNKEEGILPDDTGVNEIVFSVDSLYSAIPEGDRIMTVNYALNSAREGIKFISEKQLTMHREMKNINRYKIERHKKFTLALACLIFFFIGAPLGAIIRKGGLGMPVVISVLFFVVYYVLSLTGEKFAKEGITGTAFGMWASSVILLMVGAFLTYKATSDSAIMNKETYTQFFKKVGAILTLKRFKNGNPAY
jgi:lipopolysaccharide export system permease protein